MRNEIISKQTEKQIYLAENDAAPEVASCNSRESRGKHMRQKLSSRRFSMRLSSQLLALIMEENGHDLRRKAKVVNPLLDALASVGTVVTLLIHRLA